MLKGLIYFLLGFFLIGLIVLYELSVFDKDLDALIAKYKNEISEDSPLREKLVEQVPTVVIIRPYRKHFQHSAQFERFLAENASHSIRAFQRVKNLMNEIKPNWKKNDESESVLQSTFDISRGTENKMKHQINEIFKEHAIDLFKHNQDLENQLFENSAIAKNSKPINIGRFAHDSDDSKNNYQKKPSKEDIEAGHESLNRRLAHINEPAYWVNSVPIKSIEDIRRGKELKFKNENEFSNQMETKIGIPFMNFDNPTSNRQGLIDNYLKESYMEKMSQHTEPKIQYQKTPSKEDIEAGHESLNRRLAHINEPAYWENKLKNEDEFSNKITIKIGTPFMDIDQSTNQFYENKHYDHLKNKVYNLAIQKRNAKSYSDQLAERWLEIHGKKPYHYNEPVPSKGHRVHHSKSYSDQLAERWSKIHGKKHYHRHSKRQKDKVTMREATPDETQKENNQDYKDHETSDNKDHEHSDKE